MKRVLFLINTLGGGGAERVLVNLANHMDKVKYDVTVETMFADGVNKAFLSPDVTYICKNALNVRGISRIYRFLPARYLYRKFIGSADYDLVVGYMHNVPVKVVSGRRDKRVKAIGWCHCGTVEKSTYCTCWFTKKGANKAYNRCDALAGVSDSVVAGLKDFFTITVPCSTIYNTNDVEKIRELAKEPIQFSSDVLNICAVGRLSYEKGNDRLIEAASVLKKDGYSFRIYLVGEGREREKLEALARERQVEDCVSFVGFQSNPYPFIKNCDLLVCPSREEGLSTVVTEAVILHKPVVSTDVSGAKEILGENNEYGRVVENSLQGLCGGLLAFLDDRSLLDHYRRKAQERSVRFETAQTVKQAEQLFDTILADSQD